MDGGPAAGAGRVGPKIQEAAELLAKRRLVPLIAVLALAPLAAACVSVAEFRKLEREVRVLQREDASGSQDPDTRARIADLAADHDRLVGEIQRLEGRVEVAEHRASEALEEARAAASQLATPAASELEAAPPPQEEEALVDGGASAEVEAYRAAYDATREDPEVCVERFRAFLQTYPSSNLADDGAYWLADCYFRMGDYKAAVLRFDDVVEEYPTGNKAPDALYRQGQALLRLGPRYATAAGKAFERVIHEYPESARVAEARQQLEVLGSR